MTDAFESPFLQPLFHVPTRFMDNTPLEPAIALARNNPGPHQSTTSMGVRRDGWTAERMAVFCEALAETALIKSPAALQRRMPANPVRKSRAQAMCRANLSCVEWQSVDPTQSGRSTIRSLETDRAQVHPRHRCSRDSPPRRGEERFPPIEERLRMNRAISIPTEHRTEYTKHYPHFRSFRASP